MSDFRKLLARAALGAAAALTLAFGTAATAAEPLELTAPQARQRAAAGEVTLIDIRRPMEWRETGVPKGAARIDLLDPSGAEGFLKAVLDQVDGDRNAPIALICRTGNRSTQAQRFLLSQGFTRVYNVREGVAGSPAGPGWAQRGLPLDDCRRC